jgi:hypothetical protein
MMRVHGPPDSELITATTVTAGSAGAVFEFLHRPGGRGCEEHVQGAAVGIGLQVMAGIFDEDVTRLCGREVSTIPAARVTGMAAGTGRSPSAGEHRPAAGAGADGWRAGPLSYDLSPPLRSRASWRWRRCWPGCRPSVRAGARVGGHAGGAGGGGHIEVGDSPRYNSPLTADLPAARHPAGWQQSQPAAAAPQRSPEGHPSMAVQAPAQARGRHSHKTYQGVRK